MNKLSPLIQECLLAMLLYDKEASGFIKTLLPPSAFDPFYVDIATEAIQFLDRYGEPAGEHDLDLFNAIKARRKNDVEVFDELNEAIQGTRDTLNREFVLDQAKLYARFVRIRETIQDSLKVIEGGEVSEGDIQKIENSFAESNKALITVDDPGTSSKDIQKALSFLNKDEGDVFPTGIEPMDALGIGPARKEAYAFLAPSGKGKSWHMAHLAKHAGILARHKTLIITCEMSEERYWQRLVQCMFSVSKRNLPVDFIEFDRNENGTCIGFNEKRLRQRPNFSDDNIYGKLAKKLKGITTPLWVKQFPDGELTTPDLDTYITSLEWRHGFIPDLVIVDYPDKFAYDPRHEREEVTAIWKRLRGMAVRRNFALAAPTQANREAEDAKTTKRKNVGLALGILQIADTFVTYSQTEMEKARGLARLGIDKGRNEQDGFHIMISQAYGVGQFCMDAIRMPKPHYWTLVKEGNDASEE